MKTTYQWQPNRLAKGIYAIPGLTLMTALFLIAFHTQVARAAYQTSAIPYGLTYPEGTFNVGDTVTFIIWAGNAENSLSTVSGFDLSFTLTEDAVFPASIESDLSQSFIPTGSGMTTSTHLDASELKIDLYARNTLSSANGYGEIARFSLICDANGVEAAELLTNAGGGIIIQIDDLGLRRARNLEANALLQSSVYPNPSPGKVFWSGSPASLEAWVLRDLDGKELARGTRFPIHLRTLSVPKGMYHLSIQTLSGKRENHVLIFSP